MRSMNVLIRSTFLRPINKTVIIPAATSMTIYETDPKGGYDSSKVKLSRKEKFKLGRKIFKEEFKEWRKDMKQSLYNVYHKPIKAEEIRMEHTDFLPLWIFDGAESLKKWVLTVDNDNLEGHSEAFLSTSKSNKALFHGYLCTDVPNNGITQKAGYCNIRSPLNERPLRKHINYDWSDYTHIVMKIRGDGRNYNLNLKIRRRKTNFDIFWQDLYTYPLFTRGGPYWQYVKIPFSKFVFAFKGRVQDSQRRINLADIHHFGITLADKNDGPFQLEIDSIGLLYDAAHTEEFAYEKYMIPINTMALD